MADVGVAPAAAGNGQPQQPGGAVQGAFKSIFGVVARMALLWYVLAWWNGGNKAPPVPGTPDAIAQTATPRFAKGELVDMHAYISERPSAWRYKASDLVWSETALPLGLDPVRTHSFTFAPSEAVHTHNASLYLQLVFARTGSPINPRDPDFVEEDVFRTIHNLIRYMPRPKKSTGHNLLSGDEGAGKNTSAPARSLLPAWLRSAFGNTTAADGDNSSSSSSSSNTDSEAGSQAASVEEVEEEVVDAKELVSWFKPNITIAMVDVFTPFHLNAIPPQVAPHLRISNGDSDERKQYDPVVHFDEFWLLRDKHVRLNASVTNLTLHLRLSRMSISWFHVLQQMDQSFAMQVNMGMSKEGESEELKRVLLEGNPILLVVTFAVSLLHTVFDMLAFKNDIGFWKNNKSMEGLSARSVIINAACQLVIFLYLLDNDTSYVVLFSAFLGMCIEFWKVTKAMKVEVLPTFPYLKIADRATYQDSPTKQYDKEAMTYLSWLMYPLLIGYCVYTLLYKSHKSWYSWIVSSCVGAVYMFGFILMCPQLYLNYKLKSVAHLPWRQMTYKFLNTIIDDLFAFVIKMPTLHRLSVFRDDLVFLVYIYQRWVYRVDKTRVNEFGFSAQEDAATTAAATPAVIDGGAGGASAGTSDAAGGTVPAAKVAETTEQTLVDGAADKSGVADVAAVGGTGSKKDK